VPDTNKQQWTAPQARSFETPEQVWAYYGPKVRPHELLGLRRIIDRMADLQKQREEEERVAHRRRA
jgi:hypothetical protein